MNNQIPDVQSSADLRHVAITRVGIRDLRIPFTYQSQQGVKHSIATAEMAVALPHQQKGTHMSRFVHILNELHKNPLEINQLADLHRAMLDKLNATHGTIKLEFPFFIEKLAPVSKTASLADYLVVWQSDGDKNNPTIEIQVTVPVTSLCPCSKEISEYGAHNQRSHIIIKAEFKPESAFSTEELIRIAEEEGSCEIWATLKRPDEKWVTERAYENPKFVEDIIRDVYTRLHSDKRFEKFFVSSENFESIHNHSAYAYIDSEREF